MRKNIPLDFWSLLLIDASVVMFAVWTLCWHTVLFFHGNTFHLLFLSGFVLFLSAIFLLFFIRRGYGSNFIRNIHRDNQPPASSLNSRSDWIAGIVGWIGAATILYVWSDSRNLWLIWGGSLGFALLSGAWLLSRPVVNESLSPNHETPRRWQQFALWGLALVAAYITLIMHRANSDDALYIHIAVSAADRPYLVPFATDTIHDANVLPYVVYRVHSFELLAGVISLVTGLPAIKIIHFGFAGIAGFLTPLAWARLFRLLDPQRWFWMVLVVFCWFLADGTTTFSPPMHAFARLFQGKAILMTVGFPLIAAYGIRLGLRPCWKRFWMLIAAQIAAVGLSSTGLWIAPVVAMVSVCIPLRFRLDQLKAVGLGLISCLYVIMIGLWIRTQMGAPEGESTSVAIVSSITQIGEPSFRLIKNALDIIFGAGLSKSKPPLYFAYVAVILLSWPLAHTQLARRYVVAFGLIFVLVLADPFIYRIVNRNLTGSATYNRIVFILPTAAALAICFTTLLYIGRSTRWHVLFLAVSALSLFLFFDRVPRKTVIDAVGIGFRPTLKVSERNYETALEVARIFPAESHVLSTGGVSMIIPMVHHHPYVAMVKPNWFGDRHPERVARFRLRRIVDGIKKPLNSRRRRWFLRQLNLFRIDGIVSSAKTVRVPGFLEAMEEGGFHLLKELNRYHIWRRKPL